MASQASALRLATAILAPATSEPLGDRLADAAGAAGDDGDPTGQVVEGVEFAAIHGVVLAGVLRRWWWSRR